MHMLSRYAVISLLCVGLLPGADSRAYPRVSAWAVLHKSVQDSDWERRRQALAALSTIPADQDEAVKMVEDALQDRDARVRQSAALALGAMKATQAIPYLKEALGDTGEVAFAAAKSLTDLGDPSGREMLIDVLSGERSDAPSLLTNAVRTGQNQLRHPQKLILMGAQDATGDMFGPPAYGIAAARDVIDLKSKGTPGRAAAAAYLAKDKDPYAVTLLEWALGDDNQFVRAEAAKGLGERGNAGSVPKLEGLLTDQHTAVRTMAAASIIRLTAQYR